MNSDLQDFVKETLVQIIRGIADAQSEAKSFGAIVNPKLVEKRVTRTDGDDNEDIFGRGYRLDRENLLNAGILETMNGGIADMVAFDVAITTTTVQNAESKTSSEKGAGLRIKVVSANLDYGKDSSRSLESTDGQISHIRFKIPVMFPQGIV